MPTRMEEMASKGMGVAKEIKATFEGLHGVFKKLMEEHGEVTALLLRVKGSSDVEVRRNLFPKIHAELLSHEKGELADVYPVFRENAELATFADAHDREAGEIERMLDELSALPYADEGWGGKFERLVELVSHHVEEEEGEYFPKAEKILGEEKAEEMLPRFEATKEKVLNEVISQPH